MYLLEIAVTLTALLSFYMVSSSELTGFSLYSVKPSSEYQVKGLRTLEGMNESINFLALPSADRKSYFYAHADSENDLTNYLDKFGLKINLVVEDLQKSIDKHMLEINLKKLQYSSGPDSYDIHNFHNLADIKKILDLMAKQSPDLVNISSIGKSVEDRDIYLATLSSPEKSKKSIIVIECGIHAREWVSPAFCLWVMDNIIKNRTKLLDKYDFHILPTVNPDGYEYTWTWNRLWRKNRRAHLLCHGVDLNRNFDAGFQTRENRCSDLYSGSAAFSEPESTALREHVNKHAERIIFYYAMHSFSQMWLYPYGWRQNAPPNKESFDKLAKTAVDTIKKTSGRDYTYGQIYHAIYPAYGSSIDWVVGNSTNKFGFGIEMRDEGEYGFLMPPSEIEEACSEVWAAIFANIELYESWNSNKS